MSAIAALGLCGVFGFGLNHASLFRDFWDVWQRCMNPVVNERMEERAVLLSQTFEKLEGAWRKIERHSENIHSNDWKEFQIALKVHALVFSVFFEEHPESSQELVDLSLSQLVADPKNLKTFRAQIQEHAASVMTLYDHFKQKHQIYLQQKEAFDKDVQEIKIVLASLIASKEWSYVFKVAYAVLIVSLVIFGSLAVWKGACILLAMLWLIGMDQNFLATMERFKKLMGEMQGWTEFSDVVEQKDLERRAEWVCKIEEFYRAQYKLPQKKLQLQGEGGEEVESKNGSFEEMFQQMVVKKEAIASDSEDHNERLEALTEKQVRFLQTLVSNFF